MKFGEFIREFTEGSYVKLVDILNTGLSNLTIDENMSGEVIEVTLPADGTEIEIPHNLKITPKYRIIVRQSGKGLVIDGLAEWTERYIYLKLATLSTPSQNVNFNDYIDAIPTGIANTLTVNTNSVSNEEVTVKIWVMRG